MVWANVNMHRCYVLDGSTIQCVQIVLLGVSMQQSDTPFVLAFYLSVACHTHLRLMELKTRICQCRGLCSC